MLEENCSPAGAQCGGGRWQVVVEVDAGWTFGSSCPSLSSRSESALAQTKHPSSNDAHGTGSPPGTTVLPDDISSGAVIIIIIAGGWSRR